MPDGRPILALDVDGVISVFGFDAPPHRAPGRFYLIDGIAHCIPEETGGRINRLADAYDIVWATGWEDRANEHLPRILGLPGEFPYLTFDGRARFGTAHWKVDAIERYATGRALAWIDDSLDESCYEWAQSRSAATLLVPTESATGLTEEHTEMLLRWVRNGFATR